MVLPLLASLNVSLFEKGLRPSAINKTIKRDGLNVSLFEKGLRLHSPLLLGILTRLNVSLFEKGLRPIVVISIVNGG